jgi:hypothetical protein
MNAQMVMQWLTPIVAIVSLATTSILQVFFWYRNQRAERAKTIMEHRREALHKALRVIDHVYGNSSFGGHPPFKPHKWDLAEAWEAMNMMLIYCHDPNTSVTAFIDAMGIKGIDKGEPGSFGPEALAKFRVIVAQELGLRALEFQDKERTWIASLPGAS